MFVRSVGSVSKTGPVRSGLRSRIGPALISVRIGPTKIFRCRKMKRAESSETDFHQTWRLYDLISGGKRPPFKIFHFWKMRNFGRPFTPRGWVRLASNFGKTRFRRSPTFHFSTPRFFFPVNILIQKCIFCSKKKHLPLFGELRQTS